MFSQYEATILIVDDNQDNHFVLKQVLSGALPNASIVTAVSGKEGLRLAPVANIDMALVDVQMPGMTGIEFCRELRRQPATDS
jgi:CheY-like chemotaxis protein